MEGFPDDDTMVVVLAIAVGDELICDCDTGRMYVVITELGRQQELTGEALDDLVARGWVELFEDGLRLTEQGLYWARRWRQRMRTAIRHKREMTW